MTFVKTKWKIVNIDTATVAWDQRNMKNSSYQYIYYTTRLTIWHIDQWALWTSGHQYF